ncbi:MAG: hypothetical protein Q4C54_10790 [Clostridia bacterium]|nr:hypothetical protein [Clostridia bacterium]
MKSDRRECLIRLNLNDPDDKAVDEMLNHRNGVTVSKFFVNAVLAGKKNQLTEAALRQIIREELAHLPMQTAAAPVHEAQAYQPQDTLHAGKMSGAADDFMKSMGFD